MAALIRAIAGDSDSPQPVHLVGYSLGGRLALAVAARHPALAARVAIISGSPGLEGGSLLRVAPYMLGMRPSAQLLVAAWQSVGVTWCCTEGVVQQSRTPSFCWLPPDCNAAP